MLFADGIVKGITEGLSTFDSFFNIYTKLLKRKNRNIIGDLMNFFGHFNMFILYILSFLLNGKISSLKNLAIL